MSGALPAWTRTEQLRLELAGALVDDVRAGALLELGVGLLLVDRLGRDDRGVDGDLVPLRSPYCA